jgi:hypothetical protein
MNWEVLLVLLKNPSDKKSYNITCLNPSTLLKK